MPRNLRKLLLVVLLLIVNSILIAQSAMIRDVRVKGNVNIDEITILKVVKLRIGDYLDMSKVSESIKALNDLHVFKDILIEQESLSNGILINVDVEEYPVIASVDFKGNKKYSDSALEEFVYMRKGQYYSPFLEKKTTNQIVQKYTDKGYNAVNVTYSTEEIDNNIIDVTVKIKDGNKIRVNKISFHGNKNIESKKLRKQMETRTTNFFRSGKFDKKQFDNDIKAIEKYYHDNGYINAKVTSTEIKTVIDRYLQLDLYISEGQKYKFGDVIVVGNKFFKEDKIDEMFNFDKSEPYNQEEFDIEVNNLRGLYSEEGYIYCNIEPELSFNGDKVDIYVKIKENTRAKIREIHISGNHGTKEKVLRRELAVHPGDYFMRSKIILSQQNIYNLGFFEPNIGIDPRPINKNGDIDLFIDVEDKSSSTANGGVGYNSVDGFVGQLSVSIKNICGNNWSSSAMYEFGGTKQNIQLSFTNPNTFDSDVLTGFSLYNTEREWEDYYYKIFTRGGSVSIGKPLPWINRSKAILRYSVYSKKYDITNYDKVNAAGNSSLIRLDTLGWQITSSAGLTISRDTRDNIFFPTKGSQITIYNEIAGGPFGGDFDYYKLIAQVNWYTKLYYDFVVRSKWRAGYATEYGRSESVPPDERFYLGGTGPEGLRGYGDRSIGPKDGGIREVLFSTELAYPIGGDQLILLTFFDAGNCYNSFKDFDFMEFEKGAGLGLRIRTPMGLIGFDYAWNFRDREWTPHFQFGTNF